MKRAARPVAFAVGIIMLVYLPLMALEGVEGKMFRPMAITVAMALGGALLFTLTTFPAAAPSCCGRPGRARRGARVEVRLTEALRPALGRAAPPRRWWLRRRRLALGAIPLGSSLGAEFVPRLDEGEFSLDVAAAVGRHLDGQDLSIQVEQVVARFPEVLSVVTRPGRAEVATDPVGVDESEVMVKLRPKRDGRRRGPR